MRLRLILSTAIILLFITYGHASDTTYGNVSVLQVNSVYDGIPLINNSGIEFIT